MEHFLEKIIKSKEKDLSAFPFVHYRFVRYGKGSFNGPSLSIRSTKKTITIKGSVDYEDILAILALENMTENTINTRGKIVLFKDPKEIISKVVPEDKMDQVNVNFKKKKWEIEVDGTWERAQLIPLYEAFHDLYGYFLLSLSVEDSKVPAFTVKSKLPQSKGDYEF
ncbi:MAG: hypothetical protein ACTSYS_04350 [Promethearchaeota archaeon]